MRKFLTYILIMFVVVSLANAQDYDPMQFERVGDAFVATGVIDDTTIDAFEDALDEHPDVRILVLAFVEGSVDDDSNLELARIVREEGFTTNVPSNSLVASGGTDLFLAGVKRELESGACVGVHSWSDGRNAATAFPRDSEEHSKYLEYYEEMSIPTDFYWFTIEAAPADGMHWMNKAEASKYRLATSNAPKLGARSSCENRLQ